MNDGVEKTESLLITESASKPVLEELYTDEERQKDIKCNWHLFKCFFFLWYAAIAVLPELIFKINVNRTLPLGCILGVVLLLNAFDEGARAFGKPGFDSFPKPFDQVLRISKWLCLLWPIFGFLWITFGLLTMNSRAPMVD